MFCLSAVHSHSISPQQYSTTPITTPHTEYGALRPKRREGGGDLASRLHLSKQGRKHSEKAGDEHSHSHPVAAVGGGGKDGKWAKLSDEVSVVGIGW